MQYFFNLEKLEIEGQSEMREEFRTIPEKSLESIGITKYIKLVTIPLGNDRLQLRLENLFD